MADRFTRVFAESGDTEAIPDDTTAGTLSIQEGWPSNYEIKPGEAGSKFLSRAQNNELFNKITGNIKKWQENGAPQLYADISYKAGMEIYDDDKIYVCHASAPAATPLTNQDYFHEKTKEGFSFDVSGTVNDIVLTSKTGYKNVTQLNDYDEFSFVVAATNTGIMTIKIDDLSAVSLSSVTTGNQVFETALLNIRYIDGSFVIASQINPKTNNEVKDILKLITDSVDVLSAGEYSLDGAEISRTDHPIAFAKASAASNYIAQATKDADTEVYAGYYGDGDGSTTFTLPMVGGEFIRMFDDGRGVDDGRVFGGFQIDELKSHTHDRSAYSSVGSSGNYNMYWGGGTAQGATNSGATGGDETRPRSIAYYGKTRL